MSKAFHILSTGTWPPDIREMQNSSSIGAVKLHWREHAFIAIEYLQSPELLTKLQTLSKRDLEIIFTSKHAVLAVSGLLDHFPGHWTANMLEGGTLQTFDRVFPQACRQAAGYYAEELSAFLTREKQEKSFIFFSGDKRRDTLPTALQRHKVAWQEVVVYKTIQQPRLLDQRFDGIVFFSPSAVESYFHSNYPAPESVLFAIGSTTATAIKHYWEGVVICPPYPDKTEMYHTIHNYFTIPL